jgi:hypothetical protein
MATAVAAVLYVAAKNCVFTPFLAAISAATDSGAPTQPINDTFGTEVR